MNKEFGSGVAFSFDLREKEGALETLWRTLQYHYEQEVMLALKEGYVLPPPDEVAMASSLASITLEENKDDLSRQVWTFSFRFLARKPEEGKIQVFMHINELWKVMQAVFLREHPTYKLEEWR